MLLSIAEPQFLSSIFKILQVHSFCFHTIKQVLWKFHDFNLSKDLCYQYYFIASYGLNLSRTQQSRWKVGKI